MRDSGSLVLDAGGLARESDGFFRDSGGSVPDSEGFVLDSGGVGVRRYPSEGKRFGAGFHRFHAFQMIP